MAVELNHTIAIKVSNGVTLDFCDAEGAVEPQHYAFLVSGGVYFEEPSGHFLEIITKPYGKWDDA